MTKLFTFSIPDDSEDEVKKILTSKRKKHVGSSWIIEAIFEKHQRESYRVLDDFVKPSLELDFLPRLNEPLTREHLKQLNSDDLSMVMKMIYHNKEVIEDYFDSIQRWEAIKKELKT